MNVVRRRSIYFKYLIINLVLLITPITFLAGYSVISLKNAVEFEVIQKLHTSGREIQAIIDDYKGILSKKAQALAAEEQFEKALAQNNLSIAQESLARQFKFEAASTESVYDNTGKLLLSFYRQNGEVGSYLSEKTDGLRLKPEDLVKLQAKGLLQRIESTEKSFQFVLTSPVLAANNKVVAYLELTLDLTAEFASKMRERLGYEFLFFDSKADHKISTHEDLAIYPQSFYLEKIKEQRLDYFDLNIRGKPFAFMVYPLAWGEEKLYLGVASSKVETISAFKDLSLRLILISLVVVLIFAALIAYYGSLLFKPLFDLLRSLNAQVKQDSFSEVPVRDDTEIGAVAKSINQLAKNLRQKGPRP